MAIKKPKKQPSGWKKFTNWVKDAGKKVGNFVKGVEQKVEKAVSTVYKDATGFIKKTENDATAIIKKGEDTLGNIAMPLAIAGLAIGGIFLLSKK